MPPRPLPQTKPPKEPPKNVKGQQSNELQSVGLQNNAVNNAGQQRSHRPLPTPKPQPGHVKRMVYNIEKNKGS